MAEWREKLQINQIIARHADEHGDDEDEDLVKPELKQELEAEISKSNLLPKEDLIFGLQSCEIVDDLNYWLETLYNEADRARVWLGF